MKRLSLLIAAIVLVGAGCTAPAPSGPPQPPPPETYTAEKPGLIKVTIPLANDVITSPLTVTGQAIGPWYFEASFPVQLLDGNGKVLVAIPAQAQGDWMTNDFVPFKIVFTFKTPESATGTLVLKKDNPSGLPEHEDELRVPVRFK